MKGDNWMNNNQYQYQYQYQYQQQSEYDNSRDNNEIQQEQQTIDNKFVNDERQQYSNNGDNNDKIVQGLKQQLVFVYQGRVMSKVFGELQSKIYWSKFIAFSTIKHITSLLNQRTTKLINTINSIIAKRTTQQQLKQLFFTKITYIERNRHHSNNLKTAFFIKYFINPVYVNLGFAFNRLVRSEQVGNNRGDKVSGQRNVQNGGLKAVCDERLVKFEKQSRKYRVKQITVTLRSFIARKYLKPAFTLINLSAYYTQIQPNSQHIIQKQPQYIAKTSTNQKDARFIKKKIIPHKIIHHQQHQLSKRPYLQSSVFTLQKISIGNYEIQTVKRKHFQALRITITILEKKITSRQLYAWLRIIQSSSSNNNDKDIIVQHGLEMQNKGKVNIGIQKQDDGQSSLITSVLRTMCYVSSRATRKKQKKVTVERQKSSLIKLVTIMSTRMKHNIAYAFYSLKGHLVEQHMLIIHRISQLQQIKKQCLQYFNNSIMDEESYQIVDDHSN